MRVRVVDWRADCAEEISSMGLLLGTFVVEN